MKNVLFAIAAAAMLASPALAETSGVTVNCPSATNCSARIVFTVNGVPRPGGSAYIKHLNCSWDSDAVDRVELEVQRDDTKLTLDKYQFVLNQDERAAGAISQDTAYDVYIVNGYHIPTLNFHARTNGPVQGSCYVYWEPPVYALKRKK